MDINQLRYFFVIAKYQNFTRAASELLVAQSSLSQSMKNIEAELGVSLFVRIGRNIALSPCGVELQRRLQSILPQIDSLSSALRRLDNSNVTALNIALKASSAYFMPIIEEFSKRHPDIPLRLHSSDKTYCDFTITSEPPTGEFNGTKIAQGQPIFLLVPERSSLAGRTAVPLLETKNEKFVLQTKNHSIRKDIDSYFSLTGFQPKIAFETDFLYMIPSLVRSGKGIALTTKDAVDDMKGLCLLPISEPACKRDIYLTWHKAAAITQSMILFNDFLVEGME